MSNASPTSIQALEADIADRRARLARTVDELTTRTDPQVLIAQQRDALSRRFTEATRTPDGALRLDRIGVVVGVVAAVVALRVWGGRRRQARHP